MIKVGEKKQEWQKICCGGIFKITLGNMTLKNPVEWEDENNWLLKF